MGKYAQYNKLGAAVVSGALITIIATVFKVFYPELAKQILTPEVVGAGQTLITAAAVFFSPGSGKTIPAKRPKKPSHKKSAKPHRKP
jgi:hypothetical protein